MRSIEINITDFKNVITHLQNQLGGELKSESGEYTLELDNDLAKGTINGICFYEGISYVEYDVTFYEDVQIEMRCVESSPLVFMYCSKGSLTHDFSLIGKKETLGEFQTAILSASNNDNHRFYFAKDVNISTSMIHVEKDGAKSSSLHSLNSQFKKLFPLDSNGKSFSYFGTCNLKIEDQISQLRNLEAKGFSRALKIRGIVYMILALEIQQHTHDVNNSKLNTGSLSRSEMAKIRDISEQIKEAPEVQYTVKSLCMEWGLSPAKLQEGFKLMHGRTVTDYIRNVRVEISEGLIKNADMNISEVVYSVGLTSRSYFSKIFKEKYNCSPRQYLSQQKVLAATA